MTHRITLDDLPVSLPSAQRKVRHHIIGCEYLSGFCMESVGARDLRRDAILWIHQLRNGKSRASNLEGAPIERDLYTSTDADGNKRDDVENALARTEADAGELTRRLAAGGDISIEEKNRYAAFVANMIIRTKAFHARLTETLRREFGFTEVRPVHLHSYALMHMVKLGQIIFHMSWSVIRTSGAARFLTSDDPVSIAPFRSPGLPEPSCSVLDQRATLTLPLAMNACLVAEWRDPPAAFLTLEADHPLIGTLNLKRVASAHENIFAPEQSILPKPDDAAALRLAHPRPSLLHSDDVGLLPPQGFRLPGLTDLMEQLIDRVRKSGLPTEPIR